MSSVKKYVYNKKKSLLKNTIFKNAKKLCKWFLKNNKKIMYMITLRLLQIMVIDLFCIFLNPLKLFFSLYYFLTKPMDILFVLKNYKCDKTMVNKINISYDL